MFVVGSFLEFEHYAPVWRALVRGACTVVVPDEPSDKGWSLLADGVEAWCRTEAIGVHRAGGPRDVPWNAMPADSLLVAGGEPSADHPQTFHGAFFLAARRHGWRTCVIRESSSLSGILTVPESATVRLSDLLGEWVDAYKARLLVIGADAVIGPLARRRPDVLFIVRSAQSDVTAWAFEALPGNVVVLDDLACLISDLTTSRLLQAVDAVTHTRSQPAAAGDAFPPYVSLDAVNDGTWAPAKREASCPMTHGTPVALCEPAANHVREVLAAALSPVGTDGTSAATPAQSPLRVVAFGASSLGRSLAARIRHIPGVTLMGFLDNDRSKWAERLDGLLIMAPEEPTLSQADVVMVSSIHTRAIARQVVAAGHGHKLLLDVDDLDAVLRV